MLHKKSLICWSLLLLVTLSSCSWKPEKEVVVQTKIVKPVIEIKERPKGVKMLPVKFYVVTEKNYESLRKGLKKKTENLYSMQCLFQIMKILHLT